MSTPTVKLSAEKSVDDIIKGMLAALGAFLMFTLMNVCAKVLSETHSVIEIAFWRNAVALLPFLFMIFALGKRDLLKINAKPTLVYGRAILGAVTITVNFAAFSLMPMAETQALLFTAALFLPVLGVIFLRESVGAYRWSAVIIGLIGVLIMTRPGVAGINLLGVTAALTAAVMQALLQLTLRYLGRYESPATLTFYFFAIGTLVTAIPMAFLWVRPTLEEVPLILGVGVCGAAAQFLLSTAFRHAPAAVVAIFNYSTIVWATAFGWLIWNDWPLPTVFIGATIVIASNLFVILRESYLQRKRPALSPDA